NRHGRGHQNSCLRRRGRDRGDSPDRADRPSPRHRTRGPVADQQPGRKLRWLHSSAQRSPHLALACTITSTGDQAQAPANPTQGGRQPQAPKPRMLTPRMGRRAAKRAWNPPRPPYLGLLPKSSPRSSSAVALAGVCVTAEACTVTRSTRSSFRRSYPKLSAHANAECHIMRGQSRSWASSKRVQNGGSSRAYLARLITSSAFLPSAFTAG